MRTLDGEALGRVVRALLVYAVVAGLLLWALPWIQRTFLLPPLFSHGVRLALGLGVPVVVALAWRYPDLGDRG